MKKILIIRFSSIGDIVLTEPVCRVLSTMYPESEIYYLTKPAYKDIPALFPTVSNVLSYDSVLTAVKDLREQKFDLVIDLQKKLNSFIIKKLIKADIISTYHKQRNLRKRIVSSKKEAVGSTVALYFSALKRTELIKDGLDIEDKYYPIVKPDKIAEHSFIKPHIETLDENHNETFTIALFPGALHKTKQYPPESFVKLINAIRDIIVKLNGKKCRFYVFGSESEKALCKDIADRGQAVDWSGLFDIRSLIKIIDKTDIIISNDSGPMHLAAALGKKQIAIFGATSSKLGFKPHNKNAIIIESDLACRPCSLHGSDVCPLKHFDCMNKLEVKDIAEAVLTLLNK